jgi:hypothetical protein
MGHSIQTTRNYRLFERSDNNRPCEVSDHKKLRESMGEYGWLPFFPAVCHRGPGGRLVMDDGQHRLAIAEELGQPVHYVITEQRFDVAKVAAAGKPWTLRDFAITHAAQGKKDYARGLEFAELHGFPVGLAFALLAGTTGFTGIKQQFEAGEFRVKDESYATAVGGLYAALVGLSGEVKSARLVEACMTVCRVPDFSPGRMISAAKQCREKLVSYSTKDGYLDMLEEIYNYRAKRVVGLKAAAVNAMRSRNPAARGELIAAS